MRSRRKAVLWLTAPVALALTIATGNLAIGVAVVGASVIFLVLAAMRISWQENKVMELPVDVREYLKATFHVGEDALHALRYVSRRGKLSGYPVRRMRVFDPSLLLQPATVKRYQDMDTEQDSIRFEGYNFPGRQANPLSLRLVSPSSTIS